jgi:glycosyltransferase involved in cell wall biosynthesis
MGIDTLKMKVVFFNRKPRALGNFSVESYFKQIRANLPPTIEAISLDMPFESNGLWRRMANALYCMFHQGDVNHITGDILYVAIFLKKKKTIITILDCGIIHQTRGIKHHILKFFWLTIPVKRSKLITTISTSSQNDIISFTKCNPNKIHIIPVSISKQFKFHRKEFKSTRPRILQIGTAPNKNLERLLYALKDIPCTLVIIGQIDNRTKQIISENQIVVECINRSLSEKEIIKEYEKCDIVTLISTLEGFGMPIIEANAVGRVIITSNLSSMPEVAGNAGHLVDPFSVMSIKRGFTDLINDEKYRTKLISNGLKNQLRYDIKQISMQYSELYIQIYKID